MLPSDGRFLGGDEGQRVVRRVPRRVVVRGGGGPAVAAALAVAALTTPAKDEDDARVDAAAAASTTTATAAAAAAGGAAALMELELAPETGDDELVRLVQTRVAAATNLDAADIAVYQPPVPEDAGQEEQESALMLMSGVSDLAAADLALPGGSGGVSAAAEAEMAALLGIPMDSEPRAAASAAGASVSTKRSPGGSGKQRRLVGAGGEGISWPADEAAALTLEWGIRLGDDLDL